MNGDAERFQALTRYRDVRRPTLGGMRVRRKRAECRQELSSARSHIEHRACLRHGGDHQTAVTPW